MRFCQICRKTDISSGFYRTEEEKGRSSQDYKQFTDYREESASESRRKTYVHAARGTSKLNELTNRLDGSSIGERCSNAGNITRGYISYCKRNSIPRVVNL